VFWVTGSRSRDPGFGFKPVAEEEEESRPERIEATDRDIESCNPGVEVYSALRVQGLGFRLRVQGLGFRLRVQGLGFRFTPR